MTGHRMGRRRVFGMLAGATAASVLRTGRAQAGPSDSAAKRLNDLGSENGLMARRVGLWDVKETIWAAPDAPPVSTTGLIAERVMVGGLLQEFLRPPSDSAHRAVARTDVLSFNRVEGRWRYASFDTRVPAGLMPAASTGPGDGESVELVFDPFALLLPGTAAVGQLVRMTQVIRFLGPDQDVKDQYFMPADGTGAKVLAHRYAYTRRAS